MGTARERLVSSTAVEAVVPFWQPIEDGAIAYFSGRISAPRLEFRALRIDLRSPDITIVVRGGHSDTLSTKVSSFVRENALAAGINALPFDPVSGKEGEPRTNIGIVVSDGIMISPPQAGYSALVFYNDGGASVVSQAEIASTDDIANAAGGFHQILEAGELTERAFDTKARHPRSAAGISADGRYLYLLVVDGRRIGSIGSTEAETALMLRALGSHDGINFDGGGSSSLVMRYPNGRIRPVNTPIHDGIPGRERAVAGCLGIRIIGGVQKE
ncbi:MAG: phosphodiester glycosidase family protein [Treponema sp.]|nr:phosphodiester glycosidase family protein [Treponema sp.]